MQSDVPPLPISCLTNNIRVRRNNNLKTDRSVQGSKSNLSSKIRQGALIPLNKRKPCPSIDEPSPYKNSGRLNQADVNKSLEKSVIRQRISSAKMLRIKQLQNQLADAHFHLNELSNENKLLKAIQKRQDTALKRYEGSNAELPRIIHTHHEDLRVLQAKFKKLKSQFRVTCDLLKDKENELHSLQVQNKKLLQLSKDRQLGERDKLQCQVTDLNHRINQQDEIIMNLKRKLALDNKYLKYQLHAEMTKHKETQKQLQCTNFKLKALEELNEQKEKKSYHISRSALFNKDRSTTTSQSLTNLNEAKRESAMLRRRFRRRSNEPPTGQSLPALNGPLPQSQSQESKKAQEDAASCTTETQVNFEQVHQFRAQRSPRSHKSAASFTSSKTNVTKSPIKESRYEDIGFRDKQIDSYLSLGHVKKLYELPKSMKVDFRDPDVIGGENDEDEDFGAADVNESHNLTNGSRLMHSRLVNTDVDGARATETETKGTTPLSPSVDHVPTDTVRSDEANNYDHDSIVTVISKGLPKGSANANTSAENSYSDLESEMDIGGEGGVNEESCPSTKSERRANASPPVLSKLFNEVVETTTLPASSHDDSTRLYPSLRREDGPKLVRKAERQLDKNSTPSVVKLAPDDNAIISSITGNHGRIVDLVNLAVPRLPPNDYNRMNNAEGTSASEVGGEREPTGSTRTAKHSKINGPASSVGSVTSRANNNAGQRLAEATKGFDKAKLLAAMKAIDDNDGLDSFSDSSVLTKSAVNKFKLTDSLYKPQNSSRKSEIMKELFMDTKLDNNKASKGVK